MNLLAYLPKYLELQAGATMFGTHSIILDHSREVMNFVC